MMTQYDTARTAAPPAPPEHRDTAPETDAPPIDVERVVWDPEYRDEIRQALKSGD